MVTPRIFLCIYSFPDKTIFRYKHPKGAYEMKLSSTAKKLQDDIEETRTYMDFPTQHWTRIRTNNTH